MSRRFALFSSGAGFGRAVLDELLLLGLPPRWIALPRFPPARPRAGDHRLDIADQAAPTWPADRVDAEIIYTPQRQQQACAERLQGGCEFLLVACWPWLIDPLLIASVSSAALNLHPSLLPAFRGPDPLGEQLATGDRHFGVTLHLLGPQLDRGDIIAQHALTGSAQLPNQATLERSCAKQGALLFADAMRQFPRWRPRPQFAQSLETD